MKLAIEELAADPRVIEAQRTLLAALVEHQSRLTAIRPPAPSDAARKIAYDALLKSFGEARGGNLYFPYLGSGFGNGPFVELADGSVKFDFISGIGVHHFGHGNPTLVAAALDAALRDTIMQGNLQQNVESAGLAVHLLKRATQSPDGAPGDSKLAHCFFTSSGAMANENALKLAFHKKPGSTRILAFEHAFAGRTMALSTITDKATYRAGVPQALPVDYLPFFDSAAPEDSTARTLAAFHTITTRYPDQHAALWCEFVQGEGGFYPGSPGFFRTLFEAARARQIAVVADEVQTFGRTSQLLACQHFGVAELVDMVTVGKMLQLCATLFTDAFRPAPGILSQTFTASTSAIFAARAIVEELLSPQLFGERGRNMQVHARFAQHFEAIRARHPTWIRGPYGLGGMVAFTPHDGNEKTVKRLLTSLFDKGVIAFYNGGGGTPGRALPTRIRFLPPVPVLADAHIDTVCGLLEEALAEVAAA